jgi:enoyl-CoA hydratase/carnithine racemase
MIMLSDRVDGRLAEQWGLVHEAIAPEELDAAVERWVGKVLAMPDLALHMTKTQFRGYSRQFAQGDVSEADGEQVLLARRSPTATAKFREGF